MNDFVTLAVVVKTQGRHGEVAVEVHTDIPGRLHAGMKIFALGKEGSRRELQIEDVWPHKNWRVLKFAGVDSIVSQGVRSTICAPLLTESGVHGALYADRLDPFSAFKPDDLELISAVAAQTAVVSAATPVAPANRPRADTVPTVMPAPSWN